MKNYIKPEILEEMIECCEDICTASTGIGSNVSDVWTEGSGDSGDL